MAQVLTLESGIAQWASLFAAKDHALFLGRGVHYPIALEGAPARALRSALAISREVGHFGARLRREKRIPSLKMRIGIHTGSVVVGTLGNDLRVEFDAVGDTVNLASRMERLAEPGMIYVTEDTFQLTEGLFRFESLGERRIKGKERPVRVYSVIGAGDLQTRFDVSAERGLTPFVPMTSASAAKSPMKAST